MPKIKSCVKIFVVSFLIMILITLPFVIKNHGFFIYSGDYNYQHIAFTAHVYNMIHSGMTKTDMYTSLGTDFMTSYSHILVTPFMLITLLMPSVKAAILSVPFVTALKAATAVLTSYIYIKRYVSDDKSAFIGSLLYGFSGFQSFSLVFGSFHDITAWFPLMLLFMDEYFDDGKKYRFAIIVAIMAAMNAFFFYGQVFFLIIYFLIKVLTKTYKVTIRKFLGIAVESIVGVCMSAVLLYPGVKSLSSNSRVSSFINGIECLSYSDSSIFWRIIQSIFMMPDKAGQTSLFSGENTWTSISLYLPCVGIVFVISHIIKNRKTWESVMLFICCIMMLVPVLNSVFFMFNTSYYARWFYMPVLIMAMITAKEIEENDKKYCLWGIKISTVFLVVFALFALLPGEKTKISDGKSITHVSLAGFAPDPIYFWRTLGLSGMFLLLIYLLINKYEGKDELKNKMVCLVTAGIVVLNIVYINDVDGIDKEISDDYYGLSLTEPDFNDSSFFRINGQQSNANLIWSVPSVDNFITASAPSINDFYSEFEIKHIQIALSDIRYYPLNSLLSCKYYLSMATGDELNVERIPLEIEGFEKKDIQPFYHIFENKAYIPVGFSYDYYITESELNDFADEYGKAHPELAEDEDEEKDDVMQLFLNNFCKPANYGFKEKYLQKMLVMLRAIVIPDEDEGRVSEFIPELPKEKLENLSTETYYADCEERKSESCSNFEMTKDGFKANINSEKENLVYFSVPVMDGWSANVNGEDAEIYKVNYGFMAVKVKEGDNNIKFSYNNTNYRTGAFISLAGVIMFAVYILFGYFSGKKVVKNAES